MSAELAPDLPRAAAPTLAEKMHRALVHLGVGIDEERGDALVTKLDAIESELDGKGKGFKAEQRAGAVRFRSIAVRGLLPLPEARLDIDALRGDVVALVGAIGAGKSVLLESALLAAYGKAPTRGKFEELSVGVNASVRADIEVPTGRFSMIHAFDGPVVEDGAGFQPVKGNAKAFADFSRRHLPPLPLVLATTFLAQKSRGLLALGPAATKDLLLSMSGGDVYQRISAIAAARARDAERSAHEIGGRIDEQHRQAATRIDEERAIELLSNNITLAMGAVEHARRELAEARSIDPGDPGKNLLREAAAEAGRADQARSLAEQTRRTRHGFERTILAHGPSIRAANERLAEIEAVHRAIEDDLRRIEQEGIELTAKARSQKDDRIAGLRAAVTALGRRPKGAAAFAHAALTEDEALEERASALPGRIEALREEREKRRADLGRAAGELFEARRLAGSLAGLAQAEQLHEEAGRAIATAEEEAARAQAAAEELRARAAALRARAERPPVEALEQGLGVAEEALARLQREMAQAEARHETATRAARRMEQSQGALAEADADRDDYELIERAFGREGIQTLEVDAIGPSLVRIANELLLETARRWSVEERGAFDLRVIDHRHGRDKAPRALSFGEQVLIGEALTGALTALSCERARAVGPTIFRDETGSDLDRMDAATWIKMLRREAEMVGASRVVVTTHDRHVVGATDSQMLVRGGSVTELRLKEVR